jgi:chromosome segregation ATPase
MPPRKSDPTPETGPTDELIARFQVQTDRRLEAFQLECTRRMGAAEHRAALLTDEVHALRDQVEALQRRFEGTEHELRAATRECNTALLRAVESAESAKESAAVYERLRDSQPDYREEVNALRRELGGVSHRQSVLEGQHASIQGATDALGARLAEVKIGADSTARAISGGRFVPAGVVAVSEESSL